jgi:hypothetical protein
MLYLHEVYFTFCQNFFYTAKETTRVNILLEPFTEDKLKMFYFNPLLEQLHGFTDRFLVVSNDSNDYDDDGDECHDDISITISITDHSSEKQHHTPPMMSLMPMINQ